MTSDPTEKPIPYLEDPTGREHLLTGESVTIGRAAGNDIVITSKRVSREHARIRRDGWRRILEDLNSTNGTFLNNERIVTGRELRDRDRIKIGDVMFTFHDPDITYSDSVFPNLEIDTSAGVVRVNRQIVELSPKEFILLAYLRERANEVCSKDEIAQTVWPEYESDVYDYQIENLVRRLRAKIEAEPSDPQLLLTMRGLGYKLVHG
ncbi:MAG: winged helix-turn-helix domain-containing protein [Anaerolineae bacterium]|nr:winged helix-turn-helix domain-containing protein [Anaerolineae bacterium]